MNIEKTNKAHLLFKRLIENNDGCVIDQRSPFDKYVNQDLFREKVFGEGSAFLKHNPEYKLRTDQAKNNAELISLITNDCVHNLVSGSPSEATVPFENFHPYVFYKNNAIGEDYLIETHMFNVGYSNEKKTPVALTGIGFMYLNDAISGKKLLLGFIKITKTPSNPQVHIHISVVHELYSELTKDIKHPTGPTLFLGPHMTNLRRTLLKHSSSLKIDINGYYLQRKEGRTLFLKELVNLVKPMSPNMIDIIRLTDIKKVMY